MMKVVLAVSGAGLDVNRSLDIPCSLAILMEDSFVFRIWKDGTYYNRNIMLMHQVTACYIA